MPSPTLLDPLPPEHRLDVAIIGGGPTGLMAAEVLSKAGRRVTVFEKMPSLARRFLMAGRGGLNITHSEPLETFLERYGPARPFLEPYIRAFGPDQIKDWAAGLGHELFTGSSGRVFPRAMKASPLLRDWIKRLEAHGVTFKSRHVYTDFQADGILRFETPEGPQLFQAHQTLFALGGAAWPRLGSDGSWEHEFSSKGLSVKPFIASNVGAEIALTPHVTGPFAGAPLKPLALSTRTHAPLRGEAVITQYGLEGGGIYALNRALRTELESGPTELILDLLPDLEAATVLAKLQKASRRDSLKNRLRKAFHLKPQTLALLMDQPALRTASDEGLAMMLKALPLRVNGLRGLERAISSAGGLCLSALDLHGRIKGHKGLYAAGEMLDWDAPTGGYLLTACLAMGYGIAQTLLSDHKVEP